MEEDANQPTPGRMAVPCILVSCAFILLTMFLAEALRKIVGAIVKDGIIKVWRLWLLLLKLLLNLLMVLPTLPTE